MDVSKDEVEKLAQLSRIELTDDEVEKMRGEITDILGYVDAIQKVELPETPDTSVYFDEENVMREDAEPHEPGVHTEKLLEQAPRRDKQYVKVKKILG